MMARIRGKDTRPEIQLRRALHRRGLRYRLHDPRLPGRPDLVFPKYAAVCLVHGCFWHRHEGCRFATTPATRPAFWRAKFEANIARDARNERALRAAGWRIATVWECSLKKEVPGDVARRVEEWLASADPRFDSEESRPPSDLPAREVGAPPTVSAPLAGTA